MDTRVKPANDAVIGLARDLTRLTRSRLSPLPKRGKAASRSDDGAESRLALPWHCTSLSVDTLIIWRSYTFDPAKREATIRRRGLDFVDAESVLAGDTLDFPDLRKDYGEVHMITVGYFRDLIVVWTPRGGAWHVFSMRKANHREQARFAQQLGKG